MPEHEFLADKKSEEGCSISNQSAFYSSAGASERWMVISLDCLDCASALRNENQSLTTSGPIAQMVCSSMEACIEAMHVPRTCRFGKASPQTIRGRR